MKKKFDLKEKYRQFKAWQVRPREVAPMSQEEHECLNCHDHYTGSYCPRCGQPATTTRFSWKVTVASFINAYGLGERGMFRTMGNLLLRPGYLILDYLRGMRASYFAPFKMYFLLFAVSLLVTHGLNVRGEDFSFSADFESAVHEVREEEQAEKAAKAEMDASGNEKKEISDTDRIKEVLYGVFENAVHFANKYPALNILLLLIMMSGILYFFFRRSPNIPDLHYSEFFVTLLYTTNMYTIYSIVFDFFCLEKLSSYAFFLTMIPLKQMSGFSWWRTILKFIVALVTMLVLFILFIILGALLIGFCVKKFG